MRSNISHSGIEGHRFGHDWAIVLAAGDGTRLQALTTISRGVAVPKQFCSLNGGPSLIKQAVARASSMVPPERILVVVAEGHRFWWEKELSDLPPANLVVQPSNRGTAAGILLPLLTLRLRDPEARILVLPSDHYVADEDVLQTAAGQALARVKERGRIVLLGISPDVAEPGFGWIVPGLQVRNGLNTVSQFVEKPCRGLAALLKQRGAVWNSFIFAAGASHLMHCYRRLQPRLSRALQEAFERQVVSSRSRLRQIYAGLPPSDFSRDLLEGLEDQLEVLKVAPCGWSDLGTPDRVADCLRRVRPHTRWAPSSAVPSAPLDLNLDRLLLAQVS